MERKRKRIALVTGASSGMGRCFVHKIAEQYPFLQEIWVIARRKESLQKLRTEIGKDAEKGPGQRPEIRILALDLSHRTSFAELTQVLETERPCIRILVSAAGLGRNGRLEEQEISGVCDMIDVNCRALMAVTRLCLPYMRSGSRIVHLASGSAFLPQPGFAVYAASKACVLSFSQALREELRGKGITVTAVCPGPVNTDFFRAGGRRISPVKKKFLAEPEAVVEQALRDSRKGRALSVYGTSMKAVRLAAKLLPERVLVRISGKLFSF